MINAFAMRSIKPLSFLLAGFLISTSCFSQTKQPNGNDSLNLAKFIKKAKKELVTTEFIKNTNNNKLTTLTVYYEPRAILTLAKND
jgi:hypothetical protein